MDKLYLGFDFGTSNVAVGEIYEDEASVFHYDTHFLRFDPNIDSYDVHLEVEAFIKTILDDGYRVFNKECYAFVESVFSGPNKRTYQRMTRVGHSINIVTSNYGFESRYLDNNVWRKTLFNKGNTKKEVAQKWAYTVWPFVERYPKYRRGHCADALCIAEAGRLIVNEEKIHRPKGST